MKKFRNLKSNEIECRVAQIAEKWLSLLLYKDARCDMNILDEEIGIFNWQRHHTRDNANCIVSIKNEETGEKEPGKKELKLFVFGNTNTETQNEEQGYSLLKSL